MNEGGSTHIWSLLLSVTIGFEIPCSPSSERCLFIQPVRTMMGVDGPVQQVIWSCGTVPPGCSQSLGVLTVGTTEGLYGDVGRSIAGVTQMNIDGGREPA